MQNYYDYIDGLRENELRPVIERLLPIMALSAWGEVPDDLEIDFPSMKTADAREQAEITERNTNAILSAYQNDLIDAATAQQELQAMGEETGIFSRISDETIEAARGQTYTKSRLMADPMAGLEVSGNPPEGTDGEEW